MICHHCGGKLQKTITDLPFKVSKGSIVIIKKLPVLQCQNCQQYIIEDTVMKKVDSIIAHTDDTAELEVLSYAV